MNELFKIESGIPIQAKYATRINGITALLRSMKLGDSFAFPKAKRNGINSCARSAGIKVKVRTISETECRVWRTE